MLNIAESKETEEIDLVTPTPDPHKIPGFITQRRSDKTMSCRGNIIRHKNVPL